MLKTDALFLKLTANALISTLNTPTKIVDDSVKTALFKIISTTLEQEN